MKEPTLKNKKTKYFSSDSDTDEEYVDQLEALLARRFHKGKGKFKGKLPIIFFNCNEVGHIVARCPNKKNNRIGDKYKSKRDEGKKKITKIRARSLTTLLERKHEMNLMNMMMKWCMLQ